MKNSEMMNFSAALEYLSVSKSFLYKQVWYGVVVAVKQLARRRIDRQLITGGGYQDGGW